MLASLRDSIFDCVGYDIIYLYGKGNVSALKIIRVCDFPGLSTAFGELEATREQIMEAEQAFIRAMYGQRRGTAVGEARYRLYTMKFVKLLKVMPQHLTKKHIRKILARSANKKT